MSCRSLQKYKSNEITASVLAAAALRLLFGPSTLLSDTLNAHTNLFTYSCTPQ